MHAQALAPQQRPGKSLSPVADRSREPETAIVRPDVKRCGRCYEIKPSVEFRRIHAGTELRQTICNPCHNADRRQERLERRHRAAAQFAAKVNRSANDQTILAALAREMITRFGGLDGFVECWHSAVLSASEAGRCKSVLLSMSAILKMMQASEEPVESPDTPVEQLSDEDLQAELRPLIETVLAESSETDSDASTAGS